MKTKRTILTALCLCALTGGLPVFAQNQLPDLKAYFAATMELKSPDWDFSNTPLLGDDPADNARFSNLTGDLSKIDSYLEFALLTYYSAAERPWAERGNAILPLNNPRLVDQQLGAAVYKELQEIKFLDAQNRDRIGRYEAMLKFITDKNKITQSEINSALRAGIAAIVDEEFGKISFPLKKTAQVSYNAVLTRNPKNGQYELNYKEYLNGAWKDTTLPSISSLDALSREMLNGEHKADFNQSCVDQVRAAAALIPAVVYARNSNLQALDTIKSQIATFYTAPTQGNYNVLVNTFKYYRNLNSPEAKAASESFYNSISALNIDLAKKLYQ